MNKVRRGKIEKIADQLSEIRELVEKLHDEEQDYVDSIPEQFQNTDRAAQGEEAATLLDEAVEYLDNAIDDLRRAAE